MKYEFRGITLQQAVGNALARPPAIPLSRKDDAGERNSCRQLARWIDQLESEAGDLDGEISNIQERMRTLRINRGLNITAAAASAAAAASGALGSAERAISNLRRLLSGGKVDFDDALGMIPIIGSAITSAISALRAVNETAQIREAIEDLERLSPAINTINGTLRELENEWQENRCDVYYS